MRKKKLSNNAEIKLVRDQINEVELRRNNETDVELKISYIQEEIYLRERYTALLLKNRKLLLGLALGLAIFYLISLEIFLPFYIIRGKKRDNEDKLKKLKTELEILSEKFYKTNA